MEQLCSIPAEITCFLWYLEQSIYFPEIAQNTALGK